MGRLALSISAGIDRFTDAVGQAVSWLGLAMMMLTAAIVVLRYGFDLGWIAMQEAVLFLHTTLFMLGMAFCLRRGGHVRVDVFYRRFSPKVQAAVDLLGTLLLLTPVSLFIGYASWGYISASWRLREASSEAGGLPGVYLLKSLIIVMVATLLLQGLSEAIKAVAVLVGWRAPQAEGAADG